MKDYFLVTYKGKNEILKEKEVIAQYLIINIIILRKRKYEIVKLKDNFNVSHNLDEMIEIFKESIDIEYEDVETKEEAYKLANEYFRDLYDKRQINKEEYNEYIYKVERLNVSKSSVKKIIEKIKKLYIE